MAVARPTATRPLARPASRGWPHGPANREARIARAAALAGARAPVVSPRLARGVELRRRQRRRILSLDQRLEAGTATLWRLTLASKRRMARASRRHTSWTPALGESQTLSHSLRTRAPSFFEHLVDSSERVAEATEALEEQNSSAVLKPRDAQLLRAVPAERVLRSSWTMRSRTLWFKPAADGGPHPTLRYSRQVAGEVEFFISYCQRVARDIATSHCSSTSTAARRRSSRSSWRSPS